MIHLWPALQAWLLKLDASGEWGRGEPPATTKDLEDSLDARDLRVPYDDKFPAVDLEDAAAEVRYPDKKNKAGKVVRRGAVKRTRFRRVDLAKRKVIVVLHQTGVERSPSSKRWHLVTCHRCIGPDGTQMRVHPLNVRLVAANAADRHPWHAISIEFAGNFEGTDGTGNWWHPNSMGRGRASDRQIISGRQAVLDIMGEVVNDYNAEVIGIAPHRVFGRNEKGIPDRPICPGSRVWSEVGEWCAREYNLATPAPGWSLGGLLVPSSWRGPYYDEDSRLLV